MLFRHIQMPITVVGAMDGDKPTWTLVGHLGIIGHDRVLGKCLSFKNRMEE